MQQSQLGFLTREDTLAILGVSPSTLQDGQLINC